jgi:hypothetical protein
MKRLWLGRCWTGAWRDLAHRPLVLTAELQRLEARQASVQFGAPIRLSPVADRALVAVWWVSPSATVELPICGKRVRKCAKSSGQGRTFLFDEVLRRVWHRPAKPFI